MSYLPNVYMFTEVLILVRLSNQNLMAKTFRRNSRTQVADVFDEACPRLQSRATVTPLAHCVPRTVVVAEIVEPKERYRENDIENQITVCWHRS
jgi:hypothetical protein